MTSDMHDTTDLPTPYVDAVMAAYVECAFWASVNYDEDGSNDTPMDDDYDESDLADEAGASMLADVSDFLLGNWDDVKDLDAGQVGHDFWLTRNHHGAGFWDRGLGELGDRLTAAAHVYGESDLYVGDDGRVYVS